MNIKQPIRIECLTPIPTPGTDPARGARGARDPGAAADLLARFDAEIVATDAGTTAADSAIERAAILEYDAGLPRSTAEAAVCDVYVSTSLAWWTAPVLPDLGRTGYAQAVRSDGREYRRLDPEWYRTLHGLMAKAKRATADGRVPAEEWDRLRTTFNDLHSYAVAKYGAAALATTAPTP